MHVSYDRDGDTRNLQGTQDLSGGRWHTVSLHASGMAGGWEHSPSTNNVSISRQKVLDPLWGGGNIVHSSLDDIYLELLQRPCTLNLSRHIPNTVILTLVYLPLSLLFCKFHSLHTTCHASYQDFATFSIHDDPLYLVSDRLNAAFFFPSSVS